MRFINLMYRIKFHSDRALSTLIMRGVRAYLTLYEKQYNLRITKIIVAREKSYYPRNSWVQEIEITWKGHAYMVACDDLFSEFDYLELARLDESPGIDDAMAHCMALMELVYNTGNIDHLETEVRDVYY